MHLPAKTKYRDTTNTSEDAEKPGPTSIPGRNVNDQLCTRVPEKRELCPHRSLWLDAPDSVSAESPMPATTCTCQGPEMTELRPSSTDSPQRGRAPDTNAHGRPDAPQLHSPSETSQPRGALGHNSSSVTLGTDTCGCPSGGRAGCKGPTRPQAQGAGEALGNRQRMNLTTLLTPESTWMLGTQDGAQTAGPPGRPVCGRPPRNGEEQSPPTPLWKTVFCLKKSTRSSKHTLGPDLVSPFQPAGTGRGAPRGGEDSPAGRRAQAEAGASTGAVWACSEGGGPATAQGSWGQHSNRVNNKAAAPRVHRKEQADTSVGDRGPVTVEPASHH